MQGASKIERVAETNVPANANWQVRARELAGSCNNERVATNALVSDIDIQELDLEDAAQTAEYLRLVVANIAQGVCLYSGDERLLLCNERYGEILGVPPSLLQRGVAFSDVLRTAFCGGPNGPSPGKVQHIRKERPAVDVDASAREVVIRGHLIAMTRRSLPGGGWITTMDDITERRKAEDRLAHLARHDNLTGLANRATFLERIHAALSFGPASLLHALLCLDLDQFKPINDKFGHATGDAVLQVIAERIRARLREQDLAARLGGDEFAVLVECADEGAAAVLAEGLIADLERPIMIKGVQVVVGVSVGIALTPRHGATPDLAMGNADLALYHAKKAGRGCHRIYGPELERLAQERCALERDLRAALAKEQLALVYQPVVDIENGKITSCEALLRWTCPVRGPVSPALFIPLAEEIGLMPELGDWVLRTACREAAHWPDGLTVSVNLSPVQFRLPDLVDRIAAVLAETGLAPRRLELELTETAMIDDMSSATATLRCLKALGIAIALDDFGTGYSSLSFLRMLPFNRIKIDRSFVQDLGIKPEAAAIVRAVTGLCASLGVAATAEGVETDDQIAALRAEGCAEIQGYRISRPCPPAELLNWLTQFFCAGWPAAA